MQEKLLNSFSGPSLTYNNERIADFLYEHLDEYGDEKSSIMKAIDYAFRKNEGKGGFVLIGVENEEIVGTVVINETGMEGYIPENILVYIAIHSDHRGKGYGKKLMEHALKLCAGDVALHVEENNPAKFLYEKLGFTNPYLEMRYKQKPIVPVGYMAENPSGEMVDVHEDDYGKLTYRALIDVGVLDIAKSDFLIPEDSGLEIIGASSDMLVLDLGESKQGYEIGDIVSFKLKYMGALRLLNSDYIEKRFV